ncbi:MAG: hypothetical protein COV41_02285 [Candidatus Brennerbacteria bacterium CG11_big_fil_rev_8_21_14_0_20_43_10]|uniref:Uncharacterized protein n=2 Tax=Candidatus Brenneribacteriota TaxID=1817902 RepID=A0A2M8C1Y0_9BACT|nr:MAG: hypothetical protein AUJ43_02325 [Parcubacteria group bacterium CG1_02_44_31]PIR26096.1 MAG: hypothetical protein COV41_02285 [Candidatus Brennerbacteria bacterium CG11_big_fil_rev_8_21_14_0_20_43_10]PJB50092.1 MAG: hypothetical protein CO102_02055 [Candidatus Brennerbacteria bacterium CG_4_9_14_3_um_filter_43_9]
MTQENKYTLPLSSQTKTLLDAITHEERKTNESLLSPNLISVSNLTSGIEFLYEKIRNALDYHEEHLWLKNAIFRILKRNLLNLLAHEKIGLDLIEELTRGRYIENNYYPENKAWEIDGMLEKYREAFEVLETKTTVPEKTIRELEEWLLEFGAVELADSFLQNTQNRAYINYFWQSIKEKIEVAPDVAGEVFNEQLYLAVYRNFLQADPIMEQYELFRIKYPEWFSDSQNAAQTIGQNLAQIKLSIQHTLAYPLRKELDRVMKRRSLLVFLLKDLIAQEQEHTQQVLDNPEELEEKLKILYQARYIAGRAKLQTSAIRALIFIILTKMFLLFVGEWPYQKFVSHSTNYIALILNAIVPPLVLIASTLAIKMPGEEQNFLRMVSDFEKLIRPSDSLPALDRIRKPKQRITPVKIALGMIYGANIAFTGWILYALFSFFSYNIVDAIVFILFLSLVSFFAVRLRKTANELAAVETKEHVLTTIIEFFLFPIVEIGKFLSRAISSINIAVFVFDFLIETPLKSLTNILEEWFSFMRERKQNL